MGDDQMSGLLEWSTQIVEERGSDSVELSKSLSGSRALDPRLLRSVVGLIFSPSSKSRCEEAIDDNKVDKRRSRLDGKVGEWQEVHDREEGSGGRKFEKAGAIPKRRARHLRWKLRLAELRPFRYAVEVVVTGACACACVDR